MPESRCPACGRTSPRTRARRAAAPTTDPCRRSSGSARRASRHRVDVAAAPLGPLAPRMAVERALAQRRQLGRPARLPHRHRERRRDADVVQPPASSYSPSSSDPTQLVLPRLVPAEAGDDAVGRARVLDLDHRALARLRTCRPAGFAITPSRPAPSNRASHSRATAAIARHRRQVDRRLDARERALEPRAPLALRRRADVAAIDREQIERDERRRRLLRQLRDARRRRMQPHLQRVEVEAARRRDHDLAVDDAAVRQAGEQRVVQLGKVAIERPQVAALDEQLARRRERRSRESRPTSARTETRRSAARRPAWRASARRAA